MTTINIPNRTYYKKPIELQNFLEISVSICKCKMPPLKLHYSNCKYKLTCQRCHRRVGTMEIHGNIIVSVKDIHRFIKIVTDKYHSKPEMAQWKLQQN